MALKPHTEILTTNNKQFLKKSVTNSYYNRQNQSQRIVYFKIKAISTIEVEETAMAEIQNLKLTVLKRKGA